MLYETEKTGVTYFLGKKYPVYRMCVMIFPTYRLLMYMDHHTLYLIMISQQLAIALHVE